MDDYGVRSYGKASKGVRAPGWLPRQTIHRLFTCLGSLFHVYKIQLSQQQTVVSNSCQLSVPARGALMSCLLCGSGNEAELTAEMLIHFSGLKNIEKPAVWLFTKLLVCLDCGSSRFTVPESKLGLLALLEYAGEKGTSTRSALFR
jgi:hypothetical protein